MVKVKYGLLKQRMMDVMFEWDEVMEKLAGHGENTIEYQFRVL